MTNKEITLCFVYNLLTLPEDPRGFEKYQARTSAKNWRAVHPENVRAANQTNRKKNGHKHRARAIQNACEWQKENRERANQNKLNYHNRKLESDSSYRVEKNLRTRIYFALKAARCKSKNVMRLLGCSVEQFRAHIESQFQPGWSWDNWGIVWEIDHKRPCASFDLTDHGQREACFHFSNQRPLSVFENRSKGARVDA